MTPIRDAGGVINLEGCLQGKVKIERLTDDPREAAIEADIIMVAIPASGHREIAEKFADFLCPGQVVILNPGRTLGAIEFDHVLKERRVQDVLVAETQTIIYTSRSSENSSLVAAIKKAVRFCAYPASENHRLVKLLGKIYPQLEPAPSILHTGLANVGTILHPLPMLLNSGWIEYPDSYFYHYYDSITPRIADLLEELDAERLAVGRAYGVDLISTVEWIEEAYGIRGRNLYESLQKNESYRIVTAPKTLFHRYIQEDVPTGLIPMLELGRLAGVSTPLMSMAVELAIRLCKRDYYKEGRSLERLGLNGLSSSELRRRLLGDA